MAVHIPDSPEMRRKPRQARSIERVNRILDVAEELFVTVGYAATTTNAIAALAKVSIGSLYQFFPDKAAIVQALALRYTEQLYKRLMEIEADQSAPLPLAEYVEQIIDTTYQFFSDRPGYYAIFMQVQGKIPELQEIENAADAQLIQDLAKSLAQRNAGLEPADYETIAFILVKAIGTLLWLSLAHEETFRQHLIIETKKLSLSYLKIYFPSEC
jgi:AcrR family transcriptional regulator